MIHYYYFLKFSLKFVHKSESKQIEKKMMSIILKYLFLLISIAKTQPLFESISLDSVVNTNNSLIISDYLPSSNQG